VSGPEAREQGRAPLEPRFTASYGRGAKTLQNGLAAARERKAVVLRASRLWPGLALLIVLVGLARCSGGDEAATPPAPPTTETQEGVERAVTAAATAPDAGGGPTGAGYVARTSRSGLLAADGDFEQGVRGWDVAASGGAAATISRADAESRLGNASLALAVTTPGDVAARARGQPVRAATQHTLTVWVKSPPGTWNTLRVIGVGGDRLISPGVVGDGTWKKVVGRFETDPRETIIEIRVMQGGQPATSYIDAVQLQFEHRHAAWSTEQLLRKLDGARLPVGGRIVTLDAATLACGGEGPGTARRGERRWMHFICVQPTFPPGEIAGRDAVFRVHVTSRRAGAITDARMG
jgi:hypothetical protein